MCGVFGPVAAWCRVGPFLEGVSEVTGIAKADAFCDLAHIEIGFTQELDRQVLPGFIQDLLV